MKLLQPDPEKVKQRELKLKKLREELGEKWILQPSHKVRRKECLTVASSGTKR